MCPCLRCSSTGDWQTRHSGRAALMQQLCGAMPNGTEHCGAMPDGPIHCGAMPDGPMHCGAMPDGPVAVPPIRAIFQRSIRCSRSPDCHNRTSPSLLFAAHWPATHRCGPGWRVEKRVPLRRVSLVKRFADAATDRDDCLQLATKFSGRLTFEYVTRSAIWAKCFTGFFNRQKHSRMRIPQHLVSGRAVQRKFARRDFDRSFLPTFVVFHQPVGFHQSVLGKFAIVKPLSTMIGACRSVH